MRQTLLRLELHALVLNEGERRARQVAIPLDTNPEEGWTHEIPLREVLEQALPEFATPLSSPCLWCGRGGEEGEEEEMQK